MAKVLSYEEWAEDYRREFPESEPDEEGYFEYLNVLDGP